MTAAKQQNRGEADRAKLVKALEEVHSYLKGDSSEGYVVSIRRPKLDVREIRERLGMSQHEFAIRFGISVKTLRNWEQGHRQPEGPARAYLTIIKNNPNAVLDALNEERPMVEFRDM